MIMAILGGDDAGGGVTWAPQVIENAVAHGLVLGDNGQLYDSKKGEAMPDGVSPMPVMSDEQLQLMGEPTASHVVPRYVARYWDLMALADRQPADVIGADAKLRDRPGFEVDFITCGSIADTAYSCDQPEVLMPVKGHWKLQWDGGSTVLNSGDTCLVPAGVSRRLSPSMTGEASMYRVRNTDDPAGPTLEQH
jgi:mannose-6-phosphate isomerase-like protein (cupin superfamily)